jgi:drug/metabolite transporter (DMT)-like permease
MVQARIATLTTLALLAFAGNSLLCRYALQHTTIDAGSFTGIRLLAGAGMLWLIVSLRRGPRGIAGDWPSALALFAYAAGFSFAYTSLPAGTGALLLFGAVHVTMVSHGLWCGEPLRSWQIAGFLMAFAGLLGLLLPGLSAPPLHGAMLMLGAGVAWGIYSFRGKGAGDATLVSAGNFLRTIPLFLLLMPWVLGHMSLDGVGVWCAIASGALASGIGYAIWYAALPWLRATTAATVQLSVPVLAAIGGVTFLAEPVTVRLGLASVAVLGGIALVISHGGVKK